MSDLFPPTQLLYSVPFSLSLVALYLGLIILVAERLKRYYSSNSELTRKVVHIGTGNVILLAWWLKIPAWIGIGAAIIAAIIALISYFVPILPSINSVGRKSLGTFFYALSIGVLVGWFWPIEQYQYAAIGILVMAFGDGFAAIIGQRFGQHPYTVLGSQKSWEGSLTMVGISFIVTGLILASVYGNLGIIWLIAAIVSLNATTLESFSTLGLDNLTVPIGSAAVAFFLCQWWIS
ncbi:phosphatidate cytidylyltransferase [Aphanothece hegewaldii CCALA 016]|uniref:Phosphatidate cytidylyltransferase n=1 Tax=Aphanothece hegewaldii CCALA 016 TaxID=2107694 RepID=A0A2T1LV55_9CHRO|nr:diacylglycerol/polyprenol kinase family protein [Aphanothece hegewaldii]PSF35570.1 phosphatidate cytidylyltransferase [Aphanothece hegewaldii CCALA 016]